MAPADIDPKPQGSAPQLQQEQNEPSFRYTQTAKLTNVLEKAGRVFRSDVVTVPTEGMMQAIIDASVGDDIYNPEGDASVNALQNKLIELSGKEAALWTLSGTMGDQICLRTYLTQPPHTVLHDHRAHVQCWKSGALPVLSQAAVTQVHPKNGVHLTLEDVKRNTIADGNRELRRYLIEKLIPEELMPTTAKILTRASTIGLVKDLTWLIWRSHLL